MKKFLFLLAAPLILCGCDQLTELSKQLGGDDKIAQYIVENSEAWDDAWEDMFFTNFTMDVQYSFHYEFNGQSVDYSVHNHLELDDNAILYQIDVDEPTEMGALYVGKEGDGWIALDYNPQTQKYAEVNPLEGSIHGKGPFESYQAFKDSLASEATLSISFKSYYDKFTFDKEKNEYYCESIMFLDLNDEIYGTFNLAARKAHVKFEQGKLVSISAYYVGLESEDDDPEQLFEEFGDTYHFDITKINKTVVAKPTNLE